jgi:peptidoglycan hydrolase-like protein with peptidoglycan-binding domain
MVIRRSVGNGGKNDPEDTSLVQTLLKKAGVYPWKVDQQCGPRTVAAILAFQTPIMKTPDGLVAPGGFTWRKLSDPGTHPLNLTPPTTKPEWAGNSERWTQEKKLLSMNADFRPKVVKVLATLKEQGFQPKIFFGWRSVAVQLELYQNKKSKVKFSFHNAQTKDGTPNAYAADIIDKRWGWGPEAETRGFWTALGKIAKDEGLVWGGDWTDPWDPAHIQSRQNSELAAVKKESGL